MRAWGQLLRLSLAPSAAADAAAGMVLGAGFWPSGAAPWLMIVASLAVYHGGLGLNDWADRHHDQTTRPERPLPSGRIESKKAVLVSIALLAIGPIVAGGAGYLATVQESQPASASAALAALALGLAALAATAYDLGPRGPRLGPGMLATCRALNLGAGILLGRSMAAGAGGEWRALAACALYAAYVWTVSRLGRLEDGEDSAPLGRRPSSLLRRAAWLLVLAGSIAVLEGLLWRGNISGWRSWLPIIPAVWAAWGLVQLAAQKQWTRPLVQAAMGAALRRLILFTALVAAHASGSAGLWVGAIILAGFPISFSLRKLFPPS